jgi:hypothetical protein
VVLGADEVPLGQVRVRASAGQAQRLLGWAAAWPERTWAVEEAAGWVTCWPRSWSRPGSGSWTCSPSWPPGPGVSAGLSLSRGPPGARRAHLAGHADQAGSHAMQTSAAHGGPPRRSIVPLPAAASRSPLRASLRDRLRPNLDAASTRLASAAIEEDGDFSQRRPELGSECAPTVDRDLRTPPAAGPGTGPTGRYAPVGSGSRVGKTPRGPCPVQQHRDPEVTAREAVPLDMCPGMPPPCTTPPASTLTAPAPCGLPARPGRRPRRCSPSPAAS